MSAKDEKAFMHVRLSGQNGDDLRKVTEQTRRSLTTEANLAVEEHVLRHFKGNSHLKGNSHQRRLQRRTAKRTGR